MNKTVAPLTHSIMWASVPSLRRINNIHMIGIGGAGMGGIAEVLLNMGYCISGSDYQNNHMVNHLTKLGVNIFTNHSASNITGADVIVFSSAINIDNVELAAARENSIPIVPRAEMLAELMRFKQGIAIAGTHGKTTTTSLIASLLAEAQLEPTFVIGGRLNNINSNAKLGTGPYFVAEADESDCSFLLLSPLLSVITNIDKEHLNMYNNDFGDLKKSFIKFIHNLPFYGLAVMCADDKNIMDILPSIHRKVMTYGFSEHANIRIYNFQQIKNTTRFTVYHPQLSKEYNVKLNLPGKHNVLNAVAAIAIGVELGLEMPVMQNCFANFPGINRRLQVFGPFNLNNKNFLLMDDYGHHPREIASVLTSIRAGWKNKRIIMIYQPHRFSRTKALLEDFAKILAQADILLLLDVYAAGEDYVADADTEALCKLITKIAKKPIHIKDSNKLADTIFNYLQDGDIVLMQGAGDIGLHSRKLIDSLEDNRVKNSSNLIAL